MYYFLGYMSFMSRTTLMNQDICQPLWLIDFLVAQFPEMIYYSSSECSNTEDESSDSEDLFYGTVVMELLRHGSMDLVSRALNFIRSIDHVIRQDLPSEHILDLRNLVSLTRVLFVDSQRLTFS